MSKNPEKTEKKSKEKKSAKTQFNTHHTLKERKVQIKNRKIKKEKNF